MTTVSFFVPGVPAPQGSKSFKGFRGGKPILAESSAKVKPWRTMVTLLASEQPRLTGAISVNLEFLLPRPASVSVKKRPWPTVKPDLDKLARSTLDGLTDSGIIPDDSNITVLRATKSYSPNGTIGCTVHIGGDAAEAAA